MSLLNKYTAKLREKIKEQDGEFWYRGQRNAKWRLKSGAIDRITDEKVEVEELISYHEDLLESARSITGRGLGDLELLAQLQHYGAATCLLDMTSSFNIALWFACQRADGKEADGKVFVVPINDANARIDFLKIRSDELEEDIDYFLNPENKRNVNKEQKRASRGIVEADNKKPKFWRWEPTPSMDRMLSQASRFIFSSEDISEKKGLYYEITIAAGDKEGLLLELEQQQGLKLQSIFSDIQGLASVNARGMPHRFKQSRDYVKMGKEKMLEGDYEGAIKDFSQADKKKSNEPVVLLLRGEARIQWVFHGADRLGKEGTREQLEKAREDLEQAQDSTDGKLQDQVDEQLTQLASFEEALDDFFDELAREYQNVPRDATRND